MKPNNSTFLCLFGLHKNWVVKMPNKKMHPKFFFAVAQNNSDDFNRYNQGIKMTETINEINKAILKLNLTSSVCRIANEVEPSLYQELFAHFVEGENRKWWWESFKHDFESLNFKDGMAFEKICEIVPSEQEEIWFVVEDDESPNYPIYIATPKNVQLIIQECFSFEYYVISKDKSWLLCENHHDTLFGIGGPIIASMKKINK